MASSKYDFNARFKQACEEMKDKAEHFQSLRLESSSSEEDIDTNDVSIIGRTLSKYSEEEQNLKNVKELLQDLLTSGAIICLICIESVKRNDKVWSCKNCYCLLHLHCIQKWSKDSLQHLTSNLEDNRKIAAVWSCPKCRNHYTPAEKPSKYFCFCGKIENPVFDQWNIPHSCGKTCMKSLKPECGHKCLLLCHPGPCPPCSQTVMQTCCCSKSKKISRRCGNKLWTCNNICKKQQQCNIHFCPELCHKGPCPVCKKEKEQKCQCGSSSRIRSCYDLIWQCEKTCGKILKCKNHFCQITCHNETCPECPYSGPRICPCGGKSYFLPCTENILPCGDTCNKFLECEIHQCAQRCHYGKCGKCLQMRQMKCRCGQREKCIPCCKEFLCDVKCKLKRDCGRHSCNKKCCPGNCLPCAAICGRTLNCGNHKCSSICHPGPCYPCRDVIEVACNCGSTKISVPCGRRKAAIPPRCFDFCKLPSDCHHQNRHKHKCHFGSCPPCRLKCEKTLACGHICAAKCHSAVLTKIEKKKKKEGQWDLVNAFEFELCNKPCPPCLVPVAVTCVGGHETQSIPCNIAHSVSCGKTCGRTLACENHSCTLQCHSVENNTSLTEASESCEACFQLCSKPRKEGCTHACLEPCHPNNCKQCVHQIKLKCHCKINTIYLVCDEWITADAVRRKSLLSCCNRCHKEMNCGHRCIFLCHDGPCSTQDICKKKITLRCPCKRKRKDIQCFLSREISLFICDNECHKHKQTIQAEELKIQLEKQAKEKELREIELNEYLKKFENKKKKKKKLIQYENNFINLKIISVMAIVLCVVVIIISIYVMY